MDKDTGESENCQNVYADSDSDSDSSAMEATTLTLPKKMKRICCFRDEWLNDPELKLWIAPDSHDPSMVRCKTCSCSFSVKSDGLTAVRKHASGNKHKRNYQSQSMSETLSKFFSVPHSAENDMITASELALTYHGVKHQHSYLSQDCGTKLACRIFSDSKISKKISCGRTKAEALVENVLGPHSIELVLKELKEGSKSYSISTDASNKGNLKMYPVSVRFFSNENGVTDRLIDFYEDFDETSDGISRKLLHVLEENGLDTKNLVSYGADNASVNYGKHHSVFHSLKEKQPNLMKANCNCHVLHNAAKHACKQLPYDVETLVIKVYNEFSSSAKRLEELKKCYEFVGEEFSALLLHVPIRWLSLEPAIARLVECWKAVKTYFIAEGEEETNKLIWKFVKDQADSLIDDGVLSLPECYIHFVLSFMKIFTTAIEKLESGTTYITQVYDILDGIRNELSNRISDQFFGCMVNNNFEHLSPTQIQSFRKDATNVYTRALEYLKKWFNFDNNVLETFKILSLDEVFSFDSLLELVRICAITVVGDDLYKEYCILKQTIPKLKTKSKIDERWIEFFKNCDAPNLQKLVGYVLSIPISNANVERIFSLMKNLWTDERNRMRPELVKAELCVKVNFDQSCSDFLNYVGGQKCLLKASKSDQKYSFKRK